MQVTFLAEKECALLIGGAYLGLVDGFERRTELDPKDGLFCEFLPSGYAPVRFRLDEEFLFSPPPEVELYFVRGGVAVCCRDFVRSDPTPVLLWREKVQGLVLSLYLRGRLQLELEDGGEVRLLPLPEELSDAKLRPLGEEFLLEGSKGFAVVARDGTLKLCTEGRVLERGETLKAEIDFADSMGHTAVIERKGDRLLSYTLRSAAPPTELTFALALFESVLIGADVTAFLSEELKPKAGELKRFLGGFRTAVPTKERDVVGLVYPRKPRVFDVRYFRVTLEDGKIANIREE